MTHLTEKDYIEARLLQDRAALKASVSDLQNRFSFGGLTRKAMGLGLSGGIRSARLLGRGAKANPLGFALISAGMAWIFFGPKRQPEPEDTARWDDEGGRVMTAEKADIWSDELDVLRKLASDQLTRLEIDAAAGLTDAYGKLRDYAAERAEVVKSFAADLNHTLGLGLEDLPAKARIAALKAREQAYVAKVEAERLVRKGSRLAQDHPLIMGVVGLGLGAALAALAPRLQSRRAVLDQSRQNWENEMRLREAAVLLRETQMAGMAPTQKRASTH